MYNHTRLFSIFNFIYLLSKGRDKVRVDNNPSFVVDSKYWWCSADINPSILYLLLVHCKILFATEVLPTTIGIDSTFGSKFRIYYRKLVCILVIESTLVESNLFGDRNSISSLSLTLASEATTSSSVSSINFGYVGCP